MFYKISELYNKIKFLLKTVIKGYIIAVMKKLFGLMPRINLRFAVISLLVLVVASISILKAFYRMNEAQKQTIIRQWQDNAVQTARQIDYYMRMPEDAVSFSAVTMNEMLEHNAPIKDVGEYLINESKIYTSIIDENNTGIYGYYKGVYLDGSGWLPPEDYKPTERPWYIEAVKNGGALALVKPYLNLQTQTMMMSVSKLLDDGESVVSMDIFLDSVQEIIEQRQKIYSIEAAFVMDKTGFVVAHSSPELIGQSLAAYSEETVNELLNQIKNGANTHFESTVAKNQTVFSQEINDDWIVVYVLPSSVLYNSLVYIYIMLIIVLIVVIFIISTVFFYMNYKYQQAEQLRLEIEAVADIYEIMVRLNVKNDTIAFLRSNEDLEMLVNGDFTNYSKRTEIFAEKIASVGAQKLVQEFLDISTLEKRLEGVNSISVEYINNRGEWVRLRYIVIDRDDNAKLSHLMIAVESIDEDRKRQEALRRLSETDLMTGVKNRGCGELQVRNALAECRRGMFCLMDVDNFKSINDTYGHQTGDDVIKAIADCLKKTFRDSDIVFRLGGVTDNALGERIMSRFFNYVDKINIPALGDRKITLSVGATFYPGTSQDSFEAMYTRADEGTYRSKRQRGNLLTINDVKSAQNQD